VILLYFGLKNFFEFLKKFSENFSKFFKNFLENFKKKFFFKNPLNTNSRHILAFYRTGRLHYPQTECLVSYEEELAFFGIIPDLISDCEFNKFYCRKLLLCQKYFKRTLEILDPKIR